MIRQLLISAIFVAGLGGLAVAQDGPTDPQIAHIAYTAGQIDIAAADQAIAKSTNADIVAFAQQMKEDHAALIECGA